MTAKKKAPKPCGLLDKPFGSAILRPRKGANPPYSIDDMVWREEGKAGADQERPPSAVWADNEERRYLAEMAKLDRTLRLLLIKNKGVLARQNKAEVRREEAMKLKQSGLRTNQIAVKLKITTRRLNQIFSEIPEQEKKK
jgi:hypothetical protein